MSKSVKSIKINAKSMQNQFKVNAKSVHDQWRTPPSLREGGVMILGLSNWTRGWLKGVGFFRFERPSGF